GGMSLNTLAVLRKLRDRHISGGQPAGNHLTIGQRDVFANTEQPAIQLVPGLFAELATVYPSLFCDRCNHRGPVVAILDATTLCLCLSHDDLERLIVVDRGTRIRPHQCHKVVPTQSIPKRELPIDQTHIRLPHAYAGRSALPVRSEPRAAYQWIQTTPCVRLPLRPSCCPGKDSAPPPWLPSLPC